MTADHAVSTPPDYDEMWADVYGDMQDVGPVHRHMRRLLAELLGGITYRSVLDVGCGAGHNLPLLCEGRELDRVAGADISPKALEAARSRWPEGEFFESDIQEVSLPQRWDLVFSSLVLEHLVDDVAALRNMREMTAQHLLVTTIAGDFERYRAWDEQVGHVRNYQVGELEAKASEAGFEVVKTLYWGFPFYTPFARTMQNRMSTEPTYGLSTRLIARLMYALYFFNSRRRGDVLFLLASV